ncbi:hypothetical protein ACWCOW_42045 [Streptomyces sp. NPDC001939]
MDLAGVVVFAVDFDDNAHPAREEQQEVHSFACQAARLVQDLALSFGQRVEMEIHLWQEGRLTLAASLGAPAGEGVEQMSLRLRPKRRLEPLVERYRDLSFLGALQAMLVAPPVDQIAPGQPGVT